MVMVYPILTHPLTASELTGSSPFLFHFVHRGAARTYSSTLLNMSLATFFPFLYVRLLSAEAGKRIGFGAGAHVWELANGGSFYWKRD